MAKEITIKGAREHNLRDISITLPRGKLIVFTGLSGSGKSSLAFDTIYAEGQRRYLESLSAYARQFMEQMRKPDVDSIDGLSPSISIEQKNISRNPRSTVGTVTEIYDYLRLLYSRAGIPHCYNCGKPIQSQTIQQIVDRLISGSTRHAFRCSGADRAREKGRIPEGAQRPSQSRLRASPHRWRRSEPLHAGKAQEEPQARYFGLRRSAWFSNPESKCVWRMLSRFQPAFRQGVAEIEYFGDGAPKPRFFSTKFACVDCGTSFSEIEPRGFSFNSPHGACETLPGPRYPARFRSGSDRSRHFALASRRSGRSLVDEIARVAGSGPRTARQALQIQSRHPISKVAGSP